MKNADLPAMPFVEPATECSVAIGLTKREMFAMAAMQEIMANSHCEPKSDVHFKNIAEDACSAAVALLAELERTK